jgi:signal transduction histidine kinase
MAQDWWIPLVYFSLSALTLVLTAALTYWVHQTREFRGERTFLFMHAAAVIWTTMVAVHILATDPQLLQWIVRLELGIATVTATLWLVFCSQYANSDFHRQRWLHGAIAAGVVIYLSGIVFNPAGLMFRDIVLYSEPFAFASAERGPLYFLILMVPYSEALGGIVVLVQFLFSTRRGARARMLLLTLAVISILVFNMLSILDLAPVPEFEHASYGILPFTIFMILGVFRLGFLQIEPVARDKLVETLDDGMVVVDDDGRIADYNPRITELVPAIEDSVGESLAAVFPELAEILAAHGEMTVTTDRIRLAGDQGERHYSVRVSPLTREGSGGDLLGYSVLLRDITELERSRRELKRQNEQLDQFASIVSHDLRNPLSVADGFTEILEDDLETLADEHDLELTGLQERIDRIERAHDRMGAIVDDILTLTQESKSVEETEPLDFAAVAETAWANVETAEASLSIETDGTIEADRSRLLSIFENLFRNSLDHVGPSVSVTTGLIEDGFYVADDGPGIPESEADQIFDYGHTTTAEGTGLGLSIVETMAGSHGWELRLDQRYEAGARFVFSEVSVDPVADDPIEGYTAPDSVSSRADD